MGNDLFLKQKSAAYKKVNSGSRMSLKQRFSGCLGPLVSLGVE